jgi:galactokinase
MPLFAQLDTQFRQLFSEAPTLHIVSPGRVNLIGEHTDYNEGFVLPAAINKAIYLAVGPRTDNNLHFYAHDLGQTYTGSLTDITKTNSWADYLLGVIVQFQLAGQAVGGFNMVFGGTIPAGGGLSSSAALENGVGFALNELFACQYSRLDLVNISKQAENQFVGLQCGIMDMFASMMGKKDYAIRLDCRSLAYEYAPLNLNGVKIVLCDTRVKHTLASSEYNTRRAECAAGVSILQRFYPEINSLRDVTMDMLTEHLQSSAPLLYRRCGYVVQENERLLAGFTALSAGNLAEFGQLMYGSHNGLSLDYQVSCPELDLLVDIAQPLPGVFGARMMGGGFGGCTINLVAEEHLTQFERTVTAQYARQTDKEPLIYVCTAEDGTHKRLSFDV